MSKINYIPEYRNFPIIQSEPIYKTIFRYIIKEIRIYWLAMNSAFYYPIILLKRMFSPLEVNRTVQPKAREFEVIPDKPNGQAILMCHGFGASPDIFHEISILFANKGYYVRAIRLEGHGTSLAHLSRTSGVDWFSSVVWHYKQVSDKYHDIYFIGHSLGGTLGLLLATIYPIKTVIAMASPINLHIKSAKYVRQASIFVKYWPRSKHKREIIKEAGLATYPASPLYAIAGIFEVGRILRKRADKLNNPVLYIRAGLDHKTLVDQPDEFKKYFPNTPTIFKTAENSPHSLFLGPEKDMVYEWLFDWIDNY